MILFCMRIQPVEGRRAEALELLQSVLGPINALPGCSDLSICEELGGKHTIFFQERWAEEGGFNDHVRSPLFNRVLAAIELSSADPQVEIHGVHHTEGLGLIYRLRGVPAEKSTSNPGA
jgi:quinol monooxygenase YgiN